MKLVIFDCDGVLIDSETLGDRVVMEYLRQQHPQVDFSALEARLTGVMVADILALAETEYRVRFPQQACEAILTRLNDELSECVEAMPGVFEALCAIGSPKAVASNSTSHYVALMLRRTGLNDFFAQRIFGADQVARPKPYPDLYRFAAQRCGVAPGDCWVVEDSVPGVMAAVAAGMTVLGFSGGGHIRAGHEQRLLEAGAVAVVADMADLPAKLACASSTSAG